MSSPNQVLLHIARGEFLQAGRPDDFPLWLERYAELLGCEVRESAVAASIEMLVEKTEKLEATCRRLAGRQRTSNQ